MKRSDVTFMTDSIDQPVKIIIVGGGAGGLILACRLARKISDRSKYQVTLVDESFTHIWKPLLHEVAAGSMDSHEDEISYLNVAAKYNFNFQLGRMVGLDRQAQTITISHVKDRKGNQLVPERVLPYDRLVMAVGSVGNDFNIPGVLNYCHFLDCRTNAENLHTRILGLYMAWSDTESKTTSTQSSTSQAAQPGQPDRMIRISIIGGGATGVELAAELRSSLPKLARYGLEHRVAINLIEAGPSLLPGQPEAMIQATTRTMEKMNINLCLNTKVVEVTDNQVIADNQTIETDITIWASGVRAPDLLKSFDGVAINRNHQIVVNDQLQSISDERIFALGDCAEVTQADGKRLAPRAQIAHQQAIYLSSTLIQQDKNQATKPFHFVDKGSFVSLGDYNSVGAILSPSVINLHGLVARFAYKVLYRRHQIEIHGLYAVVILILKDSLTRILGPKIKLH